MIYKDYKLTNFRCNASDLHYIHDAFMSAVDSVIRDGVKQNIDLQVIADLIALSVGAHFNESPIDKSYKFIVERKDD